MDAASFIRLVVLSGLWGSLFLSEAVHWNTVVGAAVIIAGTSLVTNFNPLALERRKAGTA